MFGVQNAVHEAGLKNILPAVFQDTAGGYVIDDVNAVKTVFSGHLHQLNTQEMKLDTLGVFPLANASLPLLDQTMTYKGKKLEITPLLKKSRIPIYGGGAANCAYIPPEGASICRYFYELWHTANDENAVSDHEEVAAGFAILASYAGI